MTEGDEILKTAEAAARLLLSVPAVAQVALFGSVARGEDDPSDIDLFVLTRESDIPERILQDAVECGEWLYPFDEFRALQELDARNLLVELDKVTENVSVNLVIMPLDPSDGYLWGFQHHNYDWRFLEHTADDFQRFDPESACFQEAEAPWADFVEAQSAADEALVEKLREEEEKLLRLYQQEWERVGGADEFPGPMG